MSISPRSEADTAGFVPFRRTDATYDVVYDLGVATFTMRRGDLELELIVYVLPVGHSDVRLLTIRNHGSTKKRYRVVPYLDMVLDQNPSDSVGKLEAERDEATEALLFTNPKNDYHRGWAFAATSLTAALAETVRARFFGSAGRDLTNPVMVETGFPDGSADDDGRRVAGFVGEVDVPAGQAVEVAVVLGQTPIARRSPEGLESARSRRGPCGAERHAGLVGRAAQRHPCRDQQPRVRPTGQSLAALSGLDGPDLGPDRPEPARRRLWLPRPVAGRAAVPVARPAACPPADRAACRASSSAKATC